MKVMCAMSGGVDSSVAALLLKQAGHDVVGVTMKLWGGDSDTGCCSVSDVDDARRVAQQLGIDHLVFNFGDDFNEHVVAPYVDAHAKGLTPNPCIECNRSVKFARLAERAELLGFDAVATGHHARVGQTANGHYTLERGADSAKDQSYVVHMLDQAQLARHEVGQDLHVAVRVRAEAARGRDDVLVDHAQRTKTHVRRIVVFAERERVVGGEPPHVEVTAIVRRAFGEHEYQVRQPAARPEERPVLR